jgi:hypothetical protein
MRQLISFVFMFLTLSVFAQKDTTLSFFLLKTSLTSPIDIFTFPTIDLSIEKSISKKVSAAGSFGIELYDFTKADTSVISLNGYKTSLEVRYYPKSFRRGLYFSGQIFFRHDQYTSYISYLKSPHDSSNIYSDAIGVTRQCFGFNCILGFQKRIFKEIYLDSYAGLGLMNREIKNSLRDYSKDNLIYHYHGDGFPYTGSARSMSESSGKSWNFTFGLKIGWMFK